MNLNDPINGGRHSTASHSSCVLMVQIFKNNLDKRSVNFVYLWESQCTTQGDEIFRTSAGGCLKA